ncbi:VIT1/CCC1 transporter family protein [Devosia naphthalenivorans]|uniref:VIT1/CCC1 transporter family protein n=1 Tax=Devosia naphthalenivorans TaxID=2082392 RepID=UPI003CCBDF55
MDILLVYDSIFGCTAEVANIIADELRSIGHHVVMQEVHEAHRTALVRHDLAIVGSPTRGFLPTRGMREFTASLPRPDRPIPCCPGAVLIAGVAGLAAGAMSMAAGEYVSVSSQSDVERADMLREKGALIDTPAEEETELASIYESRGLTPPTAALVAREMTRNNALEAHVRDELGLFEIHSANPLQAPGSTGLRCDLLSRRRITVDRLRTGPIRHDHTGSRRNHPCLPCWIWGLFGAQAGGAPKLRPTARVLFWGAAAMAITAVIGRLFGVDV